MSFFDELYDYYNKNKSKFGQGDTIIDFLYTRIDYLEKTLDILILEDARQKTKNKLIIDASIDDLYFTYKQFEDDIYLSNILTFSAISLLIILARSFLISSRNLASSSLSK